MPLQLNNQSTSDEVDTARLVRRIRAGDVDAFNQFYARYAHRLVRYLFAIVQGDETVAADALQEAMLRIIRGLKPMETEEQLWNWIAKVGRSALFDLLRSDQRYRELLAKLPEPDGPDRSERQLRAALQDVLAELASDDRALIEAYYFKKRNQTEIAEELGSTRKAVESRLARLRDRMRTALQEALRDA